MPIDREEIKRIINEEPDVLRNPQLALDLLDELDAAYAEIERLKKELENMETYIKAKNLIDSWPDWKKEIIGNKR